MNVDVDKLKVEFAKSRYNTLLEDWYMIKTRPVTKKSEYTEEEKSLDRFLLITLLESNNVNCNCCLEDLKLL